MKSALLVLITIAACHGQGIISTVAGNVSLGYAGGFAGDGGPAVGATLYLPIGVAVDSQGNLYVADSLNNRVRKVDTAGIITTIAGNGTRGFSGDGGPATSAAFSYPSAVAVDSAGNVYITDNGNGSVRKVNTKGTISTVAGGGGSFADTGPAIGALLAPQGIALDKSGNLYITDGGGERIRRVDPGGTITTIAGGRSGFSGDGGPATSAALSSASGVAVDGAGNVYFTDVGNFRVRKVNTNGTISTIAGNGRPGFSGDAGPATSAQFNFDFGSSHEGIAVDTSGNVYIADTLNNRIRMVDAKGIINTIAGFSSSFSPPGNGDAGPATKATLVQPQDVAVDSVGNLYIADTSHNLIRKVSGGSSAVGIPAISANGVVNGASLQPGFPTNSWVTIFGSNFTSTTDNWNNSIVDGKLPTSLNGVSVTMGGKPAYIYFVSPGQINVLAPDATPGPASVTVTTGGGTSASFTATASQYGPAFFLWPGNQVVATRQDYSYAVKAGTFSGATTVSAKPGDVLVLWGTGFGPTNPAAPVGVAVPGDKSYATASTPTITINNTPAIVFGAALTPGAAGLYQIAIQVPNTLADGDWPIQASIGGVQSPPGSILSVHH